MYFFQSTVRKVSLTSNRYQFTSVQAHEHSGLFLLRFSLKGKPKFAQRKYSREGKGVGRHLHHRGLVEPQYGNI